MSDFTDFYQDIILSHNQYPCRYEENDEASEKIEAYNPVCGDQYYLYLTLKDGEFIDASFYGYGCAISKASTSILMKCLKEGGLEKFRETYGTFKKVLDPDGGEVNIDMPELEAFKGIRTIPSRHTCAILSWQTLWEHLSENR